jgi:hypothetical protein
LFSLYTLNLIIKAINVIRGDVHIGGFFILQTFGSIPFATKSQKHKIPPKKFSGISCFSAFVATS